MDEVREKGGSERQGNERQGDVEPLDCFEDDWCFSNSGTSAGTSDSSPPSIGTSANEAHLGTVYRVSDPPSCNNKTEGCPEIGEPSTRPSVVCACDLCVTDYLCVSVVRVLCVTDYFAVNPRHGAERDILRCEQVNGCKVSPLLVGGHNSHSTLRHRETMPLLDVNPRAEVSLLDIAETTRLSSWCIAQFQFF